MHYKKVNLWFLLALPIFLATLTFALSVRYSFYPLIKENMLIEKKRSVKDFMTTAHSIIAQYHKKELEGSLSKEKAQKTALEILKNLRFGFNDKDYFWVDNYDYVSVMHPYIPDITGLSLEDLKKKNGDNFTVNFINLAKKQGQGFIEYNWQWQNKTDNVEKKISYIKAFEPWQWVVGTGFYLKDIEIEAKKQTDKLGKITLIVIIIILIIGIIFLKLSRISTSKIMRQQKKYITLLENSGDGFIFIENKKIIDCNKSAGIIFGLKPRNLIGKAIIEICPDQQQGAEYSEQLLSYHFSNARKYGSTTFEWQHKRIENQKEIDFDTEITLSQVPDTNNNIFAAIVRDVTERNIILNKLEESKKILEEHNDAMITFTARMKQDGTILWANRAIIDTMEDTERRSDVIGKKIQGFNFWQHDKTVEERINEAVQNAANGYNVSYEEEIKTQDGFMNINLNIHPIYRTNNKVKYLIFEAVDITTLVTTRQQLFELNHGLEKRVSERTKELQLSYDKLEQTQKRMVAQEKMASIGQLASGVAHEINNPLCFIEHNVSALSEYTKIFYTIIKQYEDFFKNCNCCKDGKINEKPSSIINEQDYEDFKFVCDDLDKLIIETLDGIKNVTNIVKDLRIFARQENEILEDININSCIELSLNMMKSELIKKYEVKTHLQSQSFVKASHDKIGQVLINLLANAVQAMPDGGILSVRTYDKDGFATISIKDNGWGISASDLPKLFDPFFTTKEVGKGTGLGLSISLGIIEKYDGKIYAKSKPNEGAEFIIKLPISQTDG
jgi:PAS domain S-box-containing protein